MTQKIKRIIFDAEMVDALHVVAAQRKMTIQDLAALIIGNYLDQEAEQAEEDERQWDEMAGAR